MMHSEFSLKSFVEVGCLQFLMSCFLLFVPSAVLDLFFSFVKILCIYFVNCVCEKSQP